MDANQRKAKKAAADKARRARNKKQVKADAEAKKARGAMGTKKVEAAHQPEEESRKLPGKRAVQQLSKDFLAANDRAATLSGKAGELISTAVKKIHLNAREFKRAHSLKSMGLRDPAKLRIALSDFDYYRSCLELDKLAGDGLFEASEGRPVMEDESEEAEENEDESPIAADADETEHEGSPLH